VKLHDAVDCRLSWKLPEAHTSRLSFFGLKKGMLNISASVEYDKITRVK
jgi:hypothetical protein